MVLLLDDVDPGLVLVHGVEDNLKNHNPKHQPGEFRSLWILYFYPHLKTSILLLNIFLHKGWKYTSKCEIRNFKLLIYISRKSLEKYIFFP